MVKVLFKLGISIVACGVILAESAKSQTQPGGGGCCSTWQECDDFMYAAYLECIDLSQLPNPPVTYEQCQESWEVTCAYCDANFPH